MADNVQFQLDNMQFQLDQFELMKMYNKLEFKGSSSLHVLDKFSISLQLDRLLVSSNDDSLPKFALSGTLPKLSAHINEDKIHAVDRIIGLVFRDGHPPSPRTSGTEQSSQTCLTSMLAAPGSFGSDPKTEDPPESGFLFNKGNVDETVVLALVYFCIAEMSVEVQSLGKSIVELQVTGVKASLTKRLCDTSLGLSVHSLLLVDAIQTLGSNFELLAASHKNVTVDSVSGSLRGSDPVSPASPHSPMPPSTSASVGMVPHKSTSPSDIARALSALQRSKVKAICVLNHHEIGICHNQGCTRASSYDLGDVT